MTTRAQTYTIEAVLGILIIASSVTIAFGSIAVVPDSEDPAQEQRLSELERSAQGILDASRADGSLKATALSWSRFKNNGFGAFKDGSGTPTGPTSPAPDETGQYLDYPDTRFGQRLERLSSSETVDINVYIQPVYNSENGSNDIARPRRVTLIETTEATTQAVSVSTTIPLYENDTLLSDRRRYARNAIASSITPPEGRTLDNAKNYPVRPAAGPSEKHYNTLQVTVVIVDE